MTVAELIEQLRGLPDTAAVSVESWGEEDDDGFVPPSDVVSVEYNYGIAVIRIETVDE